MRYLIESQRHSPTDLISARSIKKNLRALFILALLANFIGCANLTRDTVDKIPRDPSTHWQVVGKLALSSKLPSSNPGYFKAQTLQFTFTNEGTNYRLTLNGSFGIGSTHIENRNHRLTLTRGSETLQANSADALFTELTGISFPVSNMLYWLAGGVNSSIENTPIQLRHQIPSSEFCDNGWQVKYLEQSIENNFAVPTKLTAEHRDYRVKAVMKNWQTFAATNE